MKKRRGFTWIELLIVLSILVILTAVIIPNIAAFQRANRANSAGINSELSIDRTITGTVVTIDRVGDYSTLHFSDGTTCVVSNESLDHFARLLNQSWTYELHQTTEFGPPLKAAYELIRVR